MHMYIEIQLLMLFMEKLLKMILHREKKQTFISQMGNLEDV